MMQLTSGAKPNTKLVIKGGTVKPSSEAELLKQQGNSYFVSLEYDNALHAYTQCLEKMESNATEMRVVVLSNRA